MKKTEAATEIPRPPKAQRVIRAIVFGIVIFAAIAALVFIVADKFVLNGSMSFFIINSMIGNALGELILQIGTSLFLPFFAELNTWPVVLMVLIPAVLIFINIRVVRRRIRSNLWKTVCRLVIFVCLLIFIAAVSLSMVYTDYAEHVSKKFVLSENFDREGFDDIRDAVRANKVIAQKIVDVVLLKFQDPEANIDALDDEYYMEVTELIAACFQIKGTVKSADEHYLRNHFYRAPATLDVLPYYEYGNCPASPTSSKENNDYEQNPDAQKRWRELKALIASL